MEGKGKTRINHKHAFSQPTELWNLKRLKSKFQFILFSFFLPLPLKFVIHSQGM